MFDVRLLRKIRLLVIFASIWFFLNGCSTNEKPHANKSLEVPAVKHVTEKFVVGTYTQGESEGVYLIELDVTANELVNLGVIATAGNPSYLAMSKNQSQLFAVSESPVASVNRFEYNSSTNQFDLSESQVANGNGACYIAINSDATLAAISNYGTAEVHLFELDATNKTMRLRNSFKNTGSSVNKARQDTAHMHFSQWDTDENFLYSVDLGTDEILVFDTTLTDFRPVHRVKLSPGDGPRHLAFHPNRPFVYSNNELSNTISVFEQNKQNGHLAEVQKVNLLVPEQQGDNYASAIKISTDGKFLYSAVRGVNKINVFTIDEKGKLKSIQSETVSGNWPRDFSISESGNFILVANQFSNTITVLKRDPNTGILTATNISVEISTPTFVAPYLAK